MDPLFRKEDRLLANMLKTKIWIAIFLLLSTIVGSCSSSDNEEQPTVADPEGTVEISLASFGYHYQYTINLADNVSLSLENDSFTVCRADVTNIGRVDNLSDIQYIPPVGPWKSAPEGWERIAVKPGNGYIVRSHDNKVYTRIYVVKLIMGANGQDIIGSQIKYQSPWLDYK